MSTQEKNRLLVHAIDPARLDVVRTARADVMATSSFPFAATG